MTSDTTTAVKNEVKTEQDGGVITEIPLHQRIGQNLSMVGRGRGAPKGSGQRERPEKQTSTNPATIAARKRKRELSPGSREVERAAAADRQAIAHVKRNAQALKADGRSPFFPELYYEPDEARRASKMAAIIEQVRAKRDQQGKSANAVERRLLQEREQEEQSFKRRVTEQAIEQDQGALTDTQAASTVRPDSRKAFVLGRTNMARALDEVADRTLWRFVAQDGLRLLEGAYRDCGASKPREAAMNELKAMISSDNCYKKDILENPGERPLRTFFDFSGVHDTDDTKPPKDKEAGIAEYLVSTEDGMVIAEEDSNASHSEEDSSDEDESSSDDDSDDESGSTENYSLIEEDDESNIVEE